MFISVDHMGLIQTCNLLFIYKHFIKLSVKLIKVYIIYLYLHSQPTHFFTICSSLLTNGLSIISNRVVLNVIF